MKKNHLYLNLPLFLFFSLLLSYFFLLLRQIPNFSILSHSFRPPLVSFILLSMLSFLILFGLWTLSSKIFTSAFSLRYEEVLSQDFLTFLPLLFLILAPLALSHYLSSRDLLSRARLFGLAIIFSFLYLKVILVSGWSKERQNPWQVVSKKFSSIALKKKLILLFCAALILYNAGSALMISKGITFSGDEPHYLLITHSLLHDGDFDLANNYAQRDYIKYMLPEVFIREHALPGAKAGAQYSFHSPGISFLLLPFYALGSLFGTNVLVFLIRFGMSIFGALLGLQIFLFARKEWQKENLALALWFLSSFTTPLFFYSIHVYPEIIIALFSLTIFRLLRFSNSLSSTKLLILGFLLSLFIWFHALKYFFILFPLLLYCLWVLVKRYKIRWDLIYFFFFPVFINALYFFFQYSLYGSFSLSSISWRGALKGAESLAYLKALIFGIPFRYRWETMAGYFLDQRDGLLLYAPIYFFAFLGALEMIKRKTKDFLLLVFLLAPYVFFSAFLTQRTGYAPQARPLVAICWGIGIFLGYFLVYNSKKIFMYLFSLGSFLSLVFVYLLLQNPLALYQETTEGVTERGGGLFYLLSNLHFHLPNFLPSYLKVEEGKWLPNFIWIGLVLLFMAVYLAAKKHTFSLKFSFHILLAFFGILLFFFWFVFYPREVLLRPVPTTSPSGEKITFYSLSRVAQMKEPGKFFLGEANRPYTFCFTSWRKIKNFEIEFGSFKGDYSFDFTLFDQRVFEGKTIKEIKTFVYPSPPLYRFKNVNLYQITIYLENLSEVDTAQNPYFFSILPVS